MRETGHPTFRRMALTSAVRRSFKTEHEAVRRLPATSGCLAFNFTITMTGFHAEFSVIKLCLSFGCLNCLTAFFLFCQLICFVLLEHCS